MPEKKSKDVDLSTYDGPDRVVSSFELRHELENLPQERKIMSKIPTLDKYIEGFEPGDLIAISGPTKSGKTLLAQTLTTNFYKQQEFPLWFTFEVPPRQFMRQFPDLPLFYLPRKLKAHIMPWVEERIIESFKKNHSRIVFLDHLHFLFDLALARNASLQIGTVIRSLKRIAVNNEFIIFLLCHTSKNRGEGEPNYESIRDSSFVAQESDSVFMIWRTPDTGPNTATLSVEFHRRTGVLGKRLLLHKVHGLLYEVEKEEEDGRYGKD